jgi:peptidoglycan/xylan/chitin deacetylase (PgdA/CDA1 family)
MFKTFFKSIYFNALSMSGARRRMIGRLIAGNELVVLNLHSVSPKGNPYWPPLNPGIFESLLVFLNKHFSVRLFNDLSGDAADRPIAVLSFDDGYYDFIEYALPLLEKYKMKANMNIVPQCVETGRPIWNVQLYDFLNMASERQINAIPIPGFGRKLEADSAAAKLRFGLEISRFLKSRPRAEREGIWESIGPFLEDSPEGSTRMMTADEIKQISGPTEIGVHSYSHESMGFESNDFFQDDFVKCRNYFAETLNLPLATYAFPNGSYRPEQIEFLRDNGIGNILLVDEKFADRETDVFTRLTIYGNSEREIQMKALGY